MLKDKFFQKIAKWAFGLELLVGSYVLPMQFAVAQDSPKQKLRAITWTKGPQKIDYGDVTSLMKPILYELIRNGRKSVHRDTLDTSWRYASGWFDEKTLEPLGDSYLTSIGSLEQSTDIVPMFIKTMRGDIEVVSIGEYKDKDGNLKPALKMGEAVYETRTYELDTQYSPVGGDAKNIGLRLRISPSFVPGPLNLMNLELTISGKKRILRKGEISTGSYQVLFDTVYVTEESPGLHPGGVDYTIEESKIDGVPEHVYLPLNYVYFDTTGKRIERLPNKGRFHVVIAKESNVGGLGGDIYWVNNNRINLLDEYLLIMESLSERFQK